MKVVDQVKILTLNCWGLPFTADYKTRLKEISLALGKSDYDIIFLQEVFTEKDVNLIEKECKDSLRHSFYYYSGVVGSGLMILSKYPLEDCHFFPFVQSGMVYHTGGDWFAKKGVAYALVKHPSRDLYVFTSHLHPKFEHNEHECLRTLQIFQMAGIIKSITRKNDAVVVTGDLNSEEFEPCMKFLLEYCNLLDTYLKIDKKSSNFYTCNATDNIYSQGRDPPRRIDYILHSKNMECISFNSVLNKHPTLPICYSDHKGIESVISLDLKESETDEKSVDSVLPVNSDVVDSVLNTIEKGRQTSKFNFAWFSIPIAFVSLYFHILLFGFSDNYWIDRIELTLISLFAPLLIIFTITVFISLRQQRRTYKGSLKKLKKIVLRN